MPEPVRNVLGQRELTILPYCEVIMQSGVSGCKFKQFKFQLK